MEVSETLIEQARQARAAAQTLAVLPTEQKNALLLRIAARIREQASRLLEVNRQDCAVAQAMQERGELSASAAKRVQLDERKLEQIARSVEEVASLEDPVGKVQLARQLDEGLKLYRVSCPIGVILVIFESRPDVVTQISSLALKSGNSVILKGGKEAQNTNRLLAQIVQSVLKETPQFSEHSVSLIESRDEVSQMVKLSEYLDLIIPRGSNQLVQYIQENAQVPVMGHADGICHVFLDQDADFEKAEQIVLDSKTDYPAVCNAAETLLIHQNFPLERTVKILRELQRKDVELRVCPLLKEALKPFADLNLSSAEEADWSTEYTDLILSIRQVASTAEAIDHIHHYGSAHTDAIVTENRDTACWFLETVDSAGVFWNASTRFADGFRYGFGAEVGVSTGRTHARGPVGLDGLVIYKYQLHGDGHTVGPYSRGEKTFQFKDFSLDSPSLPRSP